MSKQTQIWITKEAKRELEAMKAMTDTSMFRIASDAIIDKSWVRVRCDDCGREVNELSSSAVGDVFCICHGVMRVVR